MATYNVATAAELTTAIGKVVGGDRIVLADGSYGTLKVLNKAFTSNVTITVAPGAHAVFDGMAIQGSKNLTLSGFEIARPLAAGEPDYVQIGTIKTSSDIRMDDVFLHGSLDGTAWNDGRGLQINQASNITVTNSRFEELNQALSVFKSNNIVFKDNEFTKVRMDGITVASTDGIVIDANRMWHWQPKPADHADFIQFWNTNETKGSSNITIKNNVLMQQNPDDNIGAQGIWISDPLAHGYKNLLIQNNVVYSNDQYNGITVKGGTDVQILGNTVLSDATDAKQLWIRLENDTNVTVAGNVTDNILLTNMTGLKMGPNMNFAVTPAARGNVRDLLSPSGPGDLLVDNFGFHAPAVVPMSPVSAAMAGGLTGALSRASGLSSASLSLIPLDQAGPQLPSLDTLFGAVEHIVPFAPEPVGAPAFRFHLFAEAFVALP